MRKRARGFLHLGNIIQIPQCWIFDDAGKERRVRRGDRVRENGVRVKGEGGRPEEGAVLPQRRCGLDSTPKKCPEREGPKEVRILLDADGTFYVKLLLCESVSKCLQSDIIMMVSVISSAATRRQAVLPGETLQ